MPIISLIFFSLDFLSVTISGVVSSLLSMISNEQLFVKFFDLSSKAIFCALFSIRQYIKLSFVFENMFDILGLEFSLNENKFKYIKD